MLILLFAAAYSMQAGGTFFEWLHLWHFKRDGAATATSVDYKGFMFDFASALLQCASELTISVVLIALAFGWTFGLEAQVCVCTSSSCHVHAMLIPTPTLMLVHVFVCSWQEPLEGQVGKLLSGLHAPGKLLRGLQSPSSLFILLIAASQVVLLIIGRSLAEGSDSFHDFEHWPGVVLLSIRIVLCAIFLWALRRSRTVESNAEVLDFLNRLAWFGARVWRGSCCSHTPLLLHPTHTTSIDLLPSHSL